MKAGLLVKCAGPRQSNNTDHDETVEAKQLTVPMADA
jgi:hypothetical protein